MNQPIPCACRPSFLYTALIDTPREAWKRLVNRLRGVRDISVRQAHGRIERGAFVLDVRERREYDAGHVRGSALIPLGALGARLAELDALRQREIVVICHGGKRSASACHLLNAHGFEQTFNIAGGILAWQRAGLPVEQ